MKTKENLKVLMDVDGVLIQIMTEWCRVYNSLYPTRRKATVCDIREWDFWDIVECTQQEAYDIFGMIKIPNVPIINKNAHKYLKKIYKKYPMDIVTARFHPERDEPLILARLEEMGIYQGEHYDNLVVCSTDPKDLKYHMDYDIYIDDSPNLAKTIQSAWKRGNFSKFQIMFQRPWNWKIESNFGVIRVASWKEILKLLK